MAAGSPATLSERDSERHYMCEELVHTLAVALVCVGWLWGVLLIVANISFFESLHWLSPLALMLGSAAGYHWRERHLGLATGAVILALWLAPTVAALATGSPLFLLGMASATIIAGVLSRPPTILLMSVLSVCSTLWLATGRTGSHSLDTTLFLAIGGSLGLSWLLCHQLDVALERSWANRRYATQQMLEARERRAELRRALKALDEEYERLAHLNRELAAARREAEEARRLKAEFAANVSHELRTPLNLIAGFSEMMYMAPETYDGQLLPSVYLADVHAIYRSARHLQGLIDDVLDLSRIDARRMALTREVSDVGEVVREAADAAQELVQRKGLDLQLEVEPDLPPLSLDRTRIRQVLLNLITNALRFTEAGYIRVSCGRYSDAAAAEDGGPARREVFLPGTSYICTGVSDSGIGIHARDMERIFEEFRQVDGSVRRKQGGAGLGLAISKRFVELHGGWMWVESEVGKGSTFRFVLPAEDEVRAWAGDVEARADPTPLPSQRSLVFVDDDASVVQLLRRYLPRYRIEGAATTQQALPLIEAILPDLIVLGNGARPEEIQSLQRVHPRLADAELTVLSCPVRSEHRKALDLGMTDYLAKPVARDQLLAAIRRLGVPVHTVLVVEDEPDMMRLLQRMLAARESPVRLQKAYSGEEAQRYLCSQVPDLVLLDLALPGMSGQELLRWLRNDERLRDVPVIGLTAQTQLEDVAPLRLATLALSRREGFSLPELLAFIEATGDKFPSRYAAPAEPASPGR